MAQKDYRTIKDFATDQFIERKSRFIGYIAPVSTEEEAQAFVARISKEHRDATHNVYAYVLRKDNISRCSDNGEPQGTAGVPTLDVLLKEGLTDVCCVVTRYFGGTLLGTGGLVRAYSHAAKIAVDAAQIMNMTTCATVMVECSYSFYGKLTYMLPDYNVLVKDTSFTDTVTLTLQMKESGRVAFEKALTEASNGQVESILIETFFGDLS